MWSVPESTSDRVDWPVSDPPPWPARVRATLWWHRSTSAARELGPDGRTIPMTVAMMVDYLDSPVGPYREILASPVLHAPGKRIGPMPRMAVPFIAVDSEPSVHGGRVHWQLPKVLAEFDGGRAAEIHCNRRRMAGAFGYADARAASADCRGVGICAAGVRWRSGDRVGKADGIVPIRARERRGRGADPAGLVGCGHPSRRRDSGRKNDYGSGQASVTGV